MTKGGMSDEEYKLHMTMWAAMKSPLIIGTDINTMDAKTYSIYTNPAILALSQDPAGSPIIRKWRYFVRPGDVYGIGEIQMYSGNLDNGDYVVVLLNSASQEMHMNATAADIFVDEGGSKSAEAKSAWDVYDLWANRMPNHVANQVLNANSTVGINDLENYYYNATAMSYAEGIASNHTLLMGTKVCERITF
jgi:alpha-galactosidase